MGCGFLKSILPLIIVIQIFAQQQIRFDHLTVENGLSQSTVFSIVQDSIGYMWFATEDGLNRYDGYNFTVFRNDPIDSNSISDIGIRKIYVDKKGNLWIITLSGQLDRIDSENEKFLHYNFYSSTNKNLNHIRIIDIDEDKNGNLWVASTKGELFKFNSEDSQFIEHKFETEINLPKNINLHCIHIDEEKTFWLGTWQGLFNVNLQTEQITHYKSDPMNKNSIAGNMIFDISEDANGKIWIASVNGGVSVLNKVSEEFQVYRYSTKNKIGISSNRVLSIYCDSRSNVWIGTLDRGVDLFDPKEVKFINFNHTPSVQSSFGNGAVFSIFEDRSGNIWFGTSSGGVSKFDRKRQHFSQISHNSNDHTSLSSNVVLSICEDSFGALWIGTDGGGLNIRLPGTESFIHRFKSPDEIGSNSITAIYEDNSGMIWIGTDPGVNASAGKVFTYDRNNNSFTLFEKIKVNQGGVSTFFEDSNRNMWIGTTADGLRLYNKRNGNIREFKHDKNDSTSISGNSIFVIFEDSHNNIWIGTIAKGLNKFLPEKNKFQWFINNPEDQTTISSNSIWSIAEDSNGSLWMGSWGGGLNKFDIKLKSFSHFKIREGLPSNVVYSILPDNNGSLWISSSRGISKFNIATKEVKNYDDSDGLQSLEFNQGAFCKGKDGTFYFGGVNGVTTFHPEEIKENQIAPKTVFTNFKVFDKEIPLSQSLNSLSKIVLSYQQNFFSFEFAALDFTAPEKNQYVYKLDGVDKDWVYAGSRRFASYTDISSGEYVFRVKGSNNDGVWSKNEASISILITPPIWQTWWFRILALILLAGLLYAFHKYRLNKLLEVERTRVRIARDLHDDVSATITGMVYFSDAIDKEVGDKKTPTLQKLISLINESATNVQESMSDIIWSINPENDKWEVILPKFRRYASDLCESKGIKYKIDIPEKISIKPFKMESRRNFWLIFKEMVTNAVKHSNCSELNISISILDNKLKLVVSDDGKGFDLNILTEGNGVKNIQSRSKVLDGQVQLITSLGKGTKWEISFPV